MSETENAAPANSSPWWNEYFATQWDANEGRSQTTYFMQRLVENLPAPEREYLSSRETTVLDWGCAFGNGVDVLAKTFPRCRTVGMDFAERAIAEARRCFPRYEFRHTQEGQIGDSFDVVVTSNCLEHFAEPLGVMRQHLRGCRSLYLVLVPYRESPLHSSHTAQFREECFPERLEGFSRIATVVIDCNVPLWPGQQLLVIYGSHSYLQQRDECARRASERQAWDGYHAALSMGEIDDARRCFGDVLAERIQELLPAGGKVLEAGCGDGWQSLVLAQAGKVQLSLMDFSPEALGHAEQSFAKHKLSANFICQDIAALGEPEYDLVFNAGVLEHCDFDRQVAFLRGMASRSQKYVLALAPNRACYWYWLWRQQQSCRGQWLQGKEAPMTDLSAAFEAAGLRFLGHWLGGAEWTESFIRDLDGIDGRLREEILAVHRSPVIPEQQRAYLVAGLGCKGEAAAVPSCWRKTSATGSFALDQLSASMADALAATVAGQRRQGQLEQQVAALEKTKRQLAEQRAALEGQRDDLAAQIDRQAAELANRDRQLSQSQAETHGCQAQLNSITRSRTWRVVQNLRAVRRRLLPPGSRRESAARLAWRGARSLGTPLAALESLPRRGRLLGSSSRAADLAASCEVGGLVSVVLPVYNHADLLREAIESVLKQTYRQFELIVVNDGSRDGVERVLAEYVGHPQVRILTQPNQSLPKALSNGFEFARGEFWTWTSADNAMHPDQLRRQAAFLRANPEVGMVYADYTAIDDAGQPLSDPAFRPHNRRTPHDPDIHLPRDSQVFGQTIDNFIGPCFLYRGWIGRLLGEYDPIQGIEDFDYWLRLSLVGRIAHLDSDEPLYRYRVHANSLSGRADELQIPEKALQLMDYHRARRQFHAQPWTIHADASTLAWLNQIDAAPHRVVPWSGQQFTVGDEKHLLLVHSENLPMAAACNRSASVVLAAWFPNDADATDRYRTEAQGAADVCFAEDDATVARLALLTRHVFRAAPGPSLVALATKWADGRAFYKATRSPGQRARTLPRVFSPEGRTTRVLLQADDFTQGGMEQVAIDLACSLRDEDLDVSLLVLEKQGQDVARAQQAGIRVLSLPREDRDAHYRRLLKDQRIDVVNAHYSLYGARIAAELRIPFVQTIHNTYIVLSPAEVAAYQANDRFTSAYVCVSQMAAHYSNVRLGLPVSKMIVVSNGINLAKLDAASGHASRQSLREELGLSADDFVFLNVASLQRIKCQTALVNSFAGLAGEFPAAKLLLVGSTCPWDPAYREKVKETIALHGLERRVLVTGHRPDAMRFYSAADAFVLPSFFEGWSLALAEAIAAGLPVAATSVGSAPDLLPQVGGRLVRPPFGSIADLDQHALNDYIANEDPAFVAELTEAMRDICLGRARPLAPDALRRSFDCKEAYRPYVHLFLWLLQGGHPSSARSWTNGRPTSSATLPAADTAAA
jgi:O-antigen biosynthesis protein